MAIATKNTKFIATKSTKDTKETHFGSFVFFVAKDSVFFVAAGAGTR